MSFGRNRRKDRAERSETARGPRTVPSIAHRLPIVFAFKPFPGHARCHRSRADHGPRRTPDAPRTPETAKPGTPHYRDSPSGTVYVDFFHVNRQKRAQNLSQWPRTVPSIAGHAWCHRSRFQDSLDRGSRTLTLSSPFIIISSSSSSSRRRCLLYTSPSPRD